MHSKDDAFPGPLTKVYYRPIEAAIRWSGLHRHEASILHVLGKQQMPTPQDFPQWPALRLNTERIYDAILHSELPYGRNGVHTGSTYNTDRIEYLLQLSDVTIRHIDLRRWMLRCYPGQRPRFLFTAVERAAHPIITVQAGHALLVEQAALKTLVRQCKQQLRTLQSKYDSLLASRTQTPATSSPARFAPPTEAALSRRAETTYLGFSRHTCENDSQNPISFVKTWSCQIKRRFHRSSTTSSLSSFGTLQLSCGDCARPVGHRG
ncbi:hypothetical protein V2H26_21925 [Xanthomonas euvesicatoria]|uniref:hypothetical protein n=1 Tax=Xanthomonas citri TaxID=346 RepID=UPI002ED7702D|nr:hypothetical protein [Xanthomonas euvesicatoria]